MFINTRLTARERFPCSSRLHPPPVRAHHRVSSCTVVIYQGTWIQKSNNWTLLHLHCTLLSIKAAQLVSLLVQPLDSIRANYWICCSPILPIDRVFKISGPVDCKMCYSSMVHRTPSLPTAREGDGGPTCRRRMFAENNASPLLTCFIWWSLVLGTRMGEEGTWEEVCAWGGKRPFNSESFRNTLL